MKSAFPVIVDIPMSRDCCLRVQRVRDQRSSQPPAESATAQPTLMPRPLPGSRLTTAVKEPLTVQTSSRKVEAVAVVPLQGPLTLMRLESFLPTRSPLN